MRTGDHVTVAGTAPIAEDGGTACPGDPVGQTRRCLEIISEALDAAGARIEHVVRTRIMVTDARHWEQVARAHGEVFGEVRPACTVVEVGGFIDPSWLVEIEAAAIIHR